MKRYIVLIVVYFLVGFLLTIMTIPSSLVNTLYTVSGVLFSVGMSLIVAVNTQNIRHPASKKSVQQKLHRLMVNYIAIFLVLTTVYAITLAFKEPEKELFQELSFIFRDKQIAFNYPASLVGVEIVCILYYIINMMETRKQYYEIENLVDSEQS